MFPAWRREQTPYTWRTVSASTIQAVDPAFNPGINPKGAGTDSPWRGSDGQKAVIDGWGSAVWDDENLKLWIPIGGGHGNYAGNECYMQPLGDAAPEWTMPRPPSGAIGNLLSVDDNAERSGTYADGRPRSIHPYNNVCYAPGVGPVITRISAPYSNSNAGTHFVFALDPTTGESRRVFDFANTALTGAPSGAMGGNLGSACCYDPVRNRVVSIGIGNSIRVLWCTPRATPGTWAGGHLPTTLYASGGSAMTLLYLPNIDRYLAMNHSNSALRHALIHPDSGAMTDLGEVVGSMPSGYAFTDGGAPGAAWVPDLGVVAVWNQINTNTAQIGTLIYPGDLNSKWKTGAMTLSSSNSVVPPGHEGNGAFGTFGYSWRLGGFYLIPKYPNPTHFFATP